MEKTCRPCSAVTILLGILSACSAQVALPGNPSFSGSQAGVPLHSSNAGQVSHTGPIGVPLPAHTGFSTRGNAGVPLNTGGSTQFAPTVGVPLNTGGGSTQFTSNVGVPLNTGGSTQFTSNVGVPLNTAAGSSRGNNFGSGSSVGVPLSAATGAGTRFTTLGVSGPVLVPNIGRGIQDTKPQGNFGRTRSNGPSTFHINELPSSIELDKNLSPVPPYFVFSDDDEPERTLSIGGPKTGGLLPIANPTSDPKLLRLLSQPIVRQRLVAEARADKALKISAILMAHRQVVGGQITYASLRVAETNCPASRINSLRGCHIDHTEDSYICEVAFWERPWLNATRILDEKTGCAETESDAEFDADSQRSVGSLRKVIEGDDVGGVWSQVSSLPAALSQQQLAVEAFNYVDAHSDSSFRGYLAGHSVHSVLVDRARNLTKVQVWVDYGFTVCLKLDWTKGGQKDPRNCPVDSSRSRYSCALSLLYHPSQLMPLRVVHGDEKDELKCTEKIGTAQAVSPSGSGQSPAPLLADPAAKELQGCPGCPVQAALSDPAIMAILDFAVEEYDKMYSDDSNLHRPVSLLRAYTQASAGTKYVLTVEVAETVCRKGVPGVTRSQCARDPTEENDICIFIVLHQPWLPSSHLLSAKCFDKDDAPSYEQDLLLSSTPTLPPSAGSQSGLQLHASAGGVPLPATNGLKPVSLSFGARSQKVTPPVLDAATNKIVQFIVEQVNRREAQDDLDSRGHDDSREFDDDSREFGYSRESSDGYYQLVKVHQVAQMSGQGQQRIVLELGETNCSRSFLSRASTAHCSLDPFEEHEVCDAIVSGVGSPSPRLVALSCEDLGDYLGQSSLVPPVPSVTWVPAPFLPVGPAAGRPQTATGFSSATLTGPYASMQVASTTTPLVQKAGELVVARYNLLSGEDELARLAGVLTAHTQTTSTGAMKYLLEVEMAETICKKYLPIIDQSKCPVDPSENKIVCQAEVSHDQQQLQHSQQQTAWDGLTVNKLYCREREDYIVTRTTGKDGPWTPMAPQSPKLLQLAGYIADQYDIRSDDDDLFILHKVVSARYQNVSGIRYDVVVELAETICPKYKEHINKARCRRDPTEDIKVCNAQLFEPPSGSTVPTVIKLQCRDKQQAGHHDHSSEVLVLPSVHPSAHARPLFLSKFRKPVFRVRHDDSGESLESNEFTIGTNSRRNTAAPSRGVHRGRTTGSTRGTVRGRVAPITTAAAAAAAFSKESAESNEQFYVNPRAPGSHGNSRRGGGSRRHHDDSRSEEDDDDESDEFLSRAARRGRRRRAAGALAALRLGDLQADN